MRLAGLSNTEPRGLRSCTLWTGLAILMCALALQPSFCLAADSPDPLFAGTGEAKPQGKLDEIVFRRLTDLKIQPAKVCSDPVFLRRVYLDIIGTLPTADEARKFLTSGSAQKRRELIDQLTSRKEYADYWAMKWCDILRVKAEFPINLWPNAAQAYHRWIRTAFEQNMPYDQFVREMLTASGSNFRVAQVNFYRAMQNRSPEGIAQAMALSFMGSRADKWEREQLQGLANFFVYVGFKKTAEWKEEIVFHDTIKAAADASGGKTLTGVLPDGTSMKLFAERTDPRELVANWLISPKNPWFARNIVNRMWYWLLGRGIIHEPDDIRPDNPAQNPELLAYLEKELVTSNYDLKYLMRLILYSQTYQLSSIPRTSHPLAGENFAHYHVRRLDAEVLIDALCQITGTTEEYTSLIPEPFTFIPPDQRSIALPDGSISSSFLEMFGRPPRDTGMEDERNNNMTAAQRLHLLNSSHVQKKIEQSPKLRAILLPSRSEPRKAVDELYLTVLSRFPTDAELRTIREYVLEEAESEGKSAAKFPMRGGGRGAGTAVDLTWSLLNSAEFLYRH